MNATEKIRQGIINAFEERGMDYEVATGYGEPGYDTDKPVLLANWNELTRAECDAVERYFDIAWQDEWTVLYEEDGKAYRIQPDCYGWQPSIVIWGCEYMSQEWIVDSGNLLEYIQSELTDNPLSALNFRYDVSDELDKFSRVVESDYESGFHPWQNDNPKKILELFPDRRHNMFFVVNAVGQFDCRFELREIVGEVKA